MSGSQLLSESTVYSSEALQSTYIVWDYIDGLRVCYAVPKGVVEAWTLYTHIHTANNVYTHTLRHIYTSRQINQTRIACMYTYIYIHIYLYILKTHLGLVAESAPFISARSLNSGSTGLLVRCQAELKCLGKYWEGLPGTGTSSLYPKKIQLPQVPVITNIHTSIHTDIRTNVHIQTY